LSRTVLDLALKLLIATLDRDCQGTLSDLDGLKVLAGNVPEPRADIGQDPAQTSAIAESGRQVFGFAHDSENILVAPEWDEGNPQLESYVDGFRERLRGLGQTPERPQGLPEQSDRRLV